MGVKLASERPGFSEMEDVNFTDSELVYHVRDALRSVTLGDSNSYNELIGVIHHTEYLTPDEVALLVTSLKALSGAVSCIDIAHHDSLLSSIFRMSMWSYGPDVMDALVELIISLAASSGKYIDSCLDMLVSNFMPPHYFLALLKQPRGLARKDQVLHRVHSALRDIADLVPLAPLRLLPIILQKMPNVYSKEPMIVIYVENMLRLESGAMGELVGSMILCAVVDRLIDLDVEIEWEDILQDDFSKGIFEMELEDVEETLDDDEQEGDELPRESSSWRRFRGNVVAEKLDSLLVLMFEHLRSCNDVGRLSNVFETLLQSFKQTVMKAHKSKFSQFVMFYACSLDPGNCGVRFADILADIFTGSVSPPDVRMSAVAYLASYLSRAKFLPASFVVNILQRLVGWCWKYTESQDGDINPDAHRVFYSGCQAIMYVLCFRMRSIMDVHRMKSQLFLMPVEALLKHPLSPLKVCLPSIVEEFLRQAKAAHLFTVSETFVFNDLLESEHSRAFGGKERLDMFFPFDPCLLRKSDRYIRPNFVYWSMVRTTYDDDDEEGSSDEDVVDGFMGRSVENIAGDAMAASFEEHDLDLDEFDYSMNKMSITPKNSSNFRFGSELYGSAMRMPSRIRPSTSPESL
ncbi:RNA polymerase I-specific transcription initiation factor like [Actinidia chinensis var. chinensis]|uniref:RNA polymerase I-specific transcription initiation factor like n=1 Tax=Actinidia chinensis var. chinensis TaxID=1590841 RepID=A0A2R6S2V7_ACTCC|nr:RNA polymerase I-specific transcription initiation factor like [Actinidia chinensis var. chinensis]